MSYAPTDILFASSDTGGGHRSAAEAIATALTRRAPALHYRIDDLLRLSGVPGLRRAPELYSSLALEWLPLYDALFRITNGRRQIGALSRAADLLFARRSLSGLLAAMRPSLIIVTHPLTQRLLLAARDAIGLRCTMLTVVTELGTIHAAWACPAADLTVASTPVALEALMRHGVPPARLRLVGFPVPERFASQSGDRHAARAALGLDPQRQTILLSGGALGSGTLAAQVAMIEKALPAQQLLVVTGRNQALYRALGAGPRAPHTHLYGFVSTMEQLMAASDVVVTKAGPGTLMEALAIGRPLLITGAVGAQEQGNVDYIRNNRLGLVCPTPAALLAALQAPLPVPPAMPAAARQGADTIAALALDLLAEVPDAAGLPRLIRAP